MAAVVPNPSLSGSCSWSKNPTSSAQGAIPSGVSLANSYGRCNGVNDGALLATAYRSTSPAVNPWPTNGIVAAGTYGSVSTNVSCTPAVSQVTCSSLQVNDGCSVVINSLSAVSVQNGECFDIDYTATGSESNRANGMYVMCQTGNLSGASSCFRVLTYGDQMGFRSGSCNESGTNTTTNFLISGSQNFGSGKKFELEGITPSVYVNIDTDDYLNYECKDNNDWSNGAIWTSQCNGPTLITLKPGVSFPSNSLFTGNAGIQCKLKSGDGANW